MMPVEMEVLFAMTRPRVDVGTCRGVGVGAGVGADAVGVVVFVMSFEGLLCFPGLSGKRSAQFMNLLESRFGVS